ncbi:hypothetical protein B0H19DRAFT_1385157 [Mycena capillaripes]|nr:hypothetical protein B0H19DRAFT_1385157 [Mycena capillaripes]
MSVSVSSRSQSHLRPPPSSLPFLLPLPSLADAFILILSRIGRRPRKMVVPGQHRNQELGMRAEDEPELVGGGLRACWGTRMRVLPSYKCARGKDEPGLRTRAEPRACRISHPGVLYSRRMAASGTVYTGRRDSTSDSRNDGLATGAPWPLSY